MEFVTAGRDEEMPTASTPFTSIEHVLFRAYIFFGCLIQTMKRNHE